MLAAIAHTASADQTTLTAQEQRALAHKEAVHHWRHKVKHRRHKAIHLAKRLGVLHFHPGKVEMHTTRIRHLEKLAHRFKKRNRHYRSVIRERFPKLRCIHHYEGAWDAYSTAGPYYGGFQMDAAFMQKWGADKLRKYDGKDARYWSAKDQMAVASRAVAHIGYGPWPNTAAMCGL
jgi:hypothetical protein